MAANARSSDKRKPKPAKDRPHGNDEPLSQGGEFGLSDTADRDQAIEDGALTTTRSSVPQGPSS